MGQEVGWQQVWLVSWCPRGPRGAGPVLLRILSHLVLPSAYTLLFPKLPKPFHMFVSLLKWFFSSNCPLPCPQPINADSLSGCSPDSPLPSLPPTNCHFSVSYYTSESSVRTTETLSSLCFPSKSSSPWLE